MFTAISAVVERHGRLLAPAFELLLYTSLPWIIQSNPSHHFCWNRCILRRLGWTRCCDGCRMASQNCGPTACRHQHRQPLRIPLRVPACVKPNKGCGAVIVSCTCSHWDQDHRLQYDGEKGGSETTWQSDAPAHLVSTQALEAPKDANVWLALVPGGVELFPSGWCPDRPLADVLPGIELLKGASALPTKEWPKRHLWCRLILTVVG